MARQTSESRESSFKPNAFYVLIYLNAINVQIGYFYKPE